MYKKLGINVKFMEPTFSAPIDNKNPKLYLEQSIDNVLHKFLGKMAIQKELHNVCHEIMYELQKIDQMQALPFELNIETYYIFMVKKDCYDDEFLVEIDNKVITNPNQRYFFLECFDLGKNIRFNFSKSVQKDLDLWSDRNA